MSSCMSGLRSRTKSSKLTSSEARDSCKDLIVQQVLQDPLVSLILFHCLGVTLSTTIGYSKRDCGKVASPIILGRPTARGTKVELTSSCFQEFRGLSRHILPGFITTRSTSTNGNNPPLPVQQHQGLPKEHR